MLFCVCVSLLLCSTNLGDEGPLVEVCVHPEVVLSLVRVVAPAGGEVAGHQDPLPTAAARRRTTLVDTIVSTIPSSASYHRRHHRRHRGEMEGEEVRSVLGCDDDVNDIDNAMTMTMSMTLR